MNPFPNQTRWRKANPLKRSIISAFAKAKARAIKRHVPFDIPKGTTRDLFERSEGKCELSGIPFRPSTTGVCSPFSPSLDRVNPSEGYVVGNIRLILHGLNALKGDGTDADLLDICKAVVQADDNRHTLPMAQRWEAHRGAVAHAYLMPHAKQNAPSASIDLGALRQGNKEGLIALYNRVQSPRLHFKYLGAFHIPQEDNQ